MYNWYSFSILWMTKIIGKNSFSYFSGYLLISLALGTLLSFFSGETSEAIQWKWIQWCDDDLIYYFPFFSPFWLAVGWCWPPIVADRTIPLCFGLLIDFPSDWSYWDFYFYHQFTWRNFSISSNRTWIVSLFFGEPLLMHMSL